MSPETERTLYYIGFAAGIILLIFGIIMMIMGVSKSNKRAQMKQLATSTTTNGTTGNAGTMRINGTSATSAPQPVITNNGNGSTTITSGQMPSPNRSIGYDQLRSEDSYNFDTTIGPAYGRSYMYSNPGGYPLPPASSGW